MFAPQNVLPMTDIDSYLSFALKLFMVFGLTFEIPVVTLLLILAGIVSIQSLEEKRRYIIVGCFAVAAVVTPPDGVSMLMLAIPMWLLFELGLFLAKILIKEELVLLSYRQTKNKTLISLIQTKIKLLITYSYALNYHYTVLFLPH